MLRQFTFLMTLLCAASACFAADVPPQRLQIATVRENEQSPYYWKATAAGSTAQLLTLLCRSCQRNGDSVKDVPLVGVLRDTLGDHDPENDRLTYVWLLSYSRPSIQKRILSAVPFFYWRAGEGAKNVSAHDTAPLVDLTAPVHPVMSEVGRDIFQWTMLDPMTTPVRATSRAYRTNEIDHERLHLEEAIGYLREATVSDDESALTRAQLNTVIARLELRKRLLGGLVTEHRASRLGEEWNFEQERIRSRNWELLRQCAEKTGLIFEPLNVAGTTGQYAMLWFPLQRPPEPGGTSISPIWKLLNIKNPWNDARLKEWRGTSYNRALDENGSLLAEGAPGATQVRLVPLGVYGLNYPKMPLLLVDFRDKLHAREHEMTQRTINEITSGVIGISHFTNWYYYVAADLYDFVKSRHGGPMDQAARLDSYSQFRVALALDAQLDSRLRNEMQRRVDSLAVNPLEVSPGREMEAAIERYARIESEAQEGELLKRIDKTRRAELAGFEETKKAEVARALLHDASFGTYTHRAKQDPANLETLDRYRRIQYHLNFLDSLVAEETQPEISYDSSRIESSVMALSALMPAAHSSEMRAHAEATLLRLRELSQDGVLQADCALAVGSLKSYGTATAKGSAPHTSGGVASDAAEALR